MNNNDDYKKQHPIMYEVSQTYMSLFTSRPAELELERMISVGALLHEQLEKLDAAPTPVLNKC